MEPTLEQSRNFYGVVRRSVLLSLYVYFVEIPENGSLYIYMGREEDRSVSVIASITPAGEVDYL
jgi:hypothetical protein